MAGVGKHLDGDHFGLGRGVFHAAEVFECVRIQHIARKDRGGFVPDNMDSRPSAAQ